MVRGYTYTHRINAERFTPLAAFGLGLAAVGLFIVLSLMSSRRSWEIGVRRLKPQSSKSMNIGVMLAPQTLPIYHH